MTGWLADSDEEMAFQLARLAYDEDLRQQSIRAARQRVEQLAEPARLARQWKELFQDVQAGR